jgi:hypothetical protein
MAWTRAFADRKWIRDAGTMSIAAASARGLAAAALLLATLVPSAAFALSFGNLVVFGDSIADQGNTQALVKGIGFPDPAPAAAGYYGGRFTNGINVADVVHQRIEGTNSVGSLFGGGPPAGVARPRRGDPGRAAVGRLLLRHDRLLRSAARESGARRAVGEAPALRGLRR